MAAGCRHASREDGGAPQFGGFVVVLAVAVAAVAVVGVAVVEVVVAAVGAGVVVGGGTGVTSAGGEDLFGAGGAAGVVDGPVVVDGAAGGGFTAGGVTGVFCWVSYRFSMPFCCRLRISQRRSFDSLIPMRMSLIDSYTAGSFNSLLAVPFPWLILSTEVLSSCTRPVNSFSAWSP